MTDVTVTGLSKSFGSVRVLRDIDLHVPSGTITAILGPSGCGKTTLLRLIAGFERPDAGAILLDGHAIAERGHSVPPERRHIGYVAQEGALFPHLDVAGNISFGLSRFGLPRAARRQGSRVEELLEMVGLQASYARRYPHELSGGQQQRVALARALAPRPRIVLLDEPFSSLDAGLRDGTRRAVMQALAAVDATAILVTHDQSEALSVASQVAVMRDGHFAQVGSPIDLYSAPVDIEVGTFLGEAVLLAGVICDGKAECDLGQLSVRCGATNGIVTVLLRPEQIVIDGTEGAAPNAVVTGLTYYGHDAEVQLRLLASGTVVTARVPGFSCLPPGNKVCAAVQGPVVAYPTASKQV